MPAKRAVCLARIMGEILAQKASSPTAVVTKKLKEDGTGVTKKLEEDGPAVTTDKEWSMVSWNVAGVRAWHKKKGHEFLQSTFDFVLLQELKAKELPAGLFPGYHISIAPSEKSGHGGVALLSKIEPLSLNYGIGDSHFDSAGGRLIIGEFPHFYLLCAYVPNSGRGLVNLEQRKRWDELFLEKIVQLDKEKPVIYAGDLNVAHQEIDLANPKSNHNKTAGFTDQERDAFSRLLDAGFIDVYRHLHPTATGAYTFWSYMHNARAGNVGWRLDYFVVSARIVDRVRECRIHEKELGSDHCPLSIRIRL